MKYSIHPIFPSIVHEVVLSDFDYIKRKTLIDKIYYMRDHSCGVKNSNVGGWQSDSITNEEIFQEDISYIMSMIQFDFKLYETWININEPGSYNISHIHPGASLAGVFYINAPDNCGDIYFDNPNRYCASSLISRYDEQLNNSFNHAERYRISPKSGTILLFPGDLSHCVGRNDSENDRISISFNLAP